MNKRHFAGCLVLALWLGFAGQGLAKAGDDVAKPAVWPEAGDRTPADYVNPLVETAKSRWFFFASACRPFGMVGLSPDTRLGADWRHGYLYDDTQIQCFSQIHAWQLSGIPVMPITGEMHAQEGLAAAASDFSHQDEVIHPGYHKVFLKRYGVTAELTSTTRVGFHRYTFPAGSPAYLAFDTGATLVTDMSSSAVRQTGSREIAGYSVMAPVLRRPKPFTVYFVAQFSKPVKFGAWRNKALLPESIREIAGTNVGGYVSFPTTNGEQVLVKVAISYVSEANARQNLAAELPGWDFDGVVRESKDDWNRWLGRIEVEGGTEAQRVKFYTDLWHALRGRGIVSDVDGSYCDMTGPAPVVQRVRLDAEGKPLFPHYENDSWWGSHWSLNILWSFAYPEVMDGFCNSMLDMYCHDGLIPRGPTGGNYVFCMIGDPATPIFAAAYSKGIRHYDVEKAYEGLRKNALPGGLRDHAGYEWGTNACGGGMKYYIDRGYVPEDGDGTGMHKDGASMTLEYAYQDWCLAQMARGLGKEKDYQWLLGRSFNYTNLWDASAKFMHPRFKDGSWLPDFMTAWTNNGAYSIGFCEASFAIYTHYVPQDVTGLARLFGGSEAYGNALNRQFELAAPDRFLPARLGGTNDWQTRHTVWVDYGNEPSMGMAYMFNLAGSPWLSQKWVRAVKIRTFGDITPYGGYNDDEDQGQLGSLGVLMAIGLFDVQGGAALQPTYQITSPLFDRVTIRLNRDYFPGDKFVIATQNNSATNIYIQSAKLNGRPLNRVSFPHADLVKGGRLELDLGPEPSRWGAGSAPPE